MASTNSKAENLLQGLQAGSLNKQNGVMRRPSPGEKYKSAYGVGMNQIDPVNCSFCFRLTSATPLVRAVTDISKDEQHLIATRTATSMEA